MTIASSSKKRIQWDKTLVSESAAGNWSWIHQDLGIPIGHMKPGVSEQVSNKGGGSDKLKKFPDYDQTGGVILNEQEFLATGFLVVAWWNNWTGSQGQSDAYNQVGDHLHSSQMLEIPEKPAKPAAQAAVSRGKGTPDSITNGKPLSPRSNAEKPPVNPHKVSETRKKTGMVPIDRTKQLHREAAAMFAKAKPGILAETILNSGCEIGRWYDGALVLGMPAYLSSDAGEPVHAMILYKVNGERFAAYGDLPERKVHLVMVKDSGDSWFVVGGPERLRLANFVLRVEGSTDALAIAGIVPDDWAVVTNTLGAQLHFSGPSAPDFSVFAGKSLIVLGDNDSSGLGQRSARAFAETASHHAEKSFLPSLPEKYKDARDWVAAGNGWCEVEGLFEAAEHILPVETPDETQNEITIQPGEGAVSEQAHSKQQQQTFIEGQRVQCGDLGNVGTVVSDDGGDTVEIHFVSKAGVQATKGIPREQVSPIGGTINSEVLPRRSPISLWSGIKNPRPMRAVIIEGILRRGEVCNIIASTKTGKSWLAMLLALCVALGRNWLGRSVQKGNVVVVDNELHVETLENRLATVANALQIPSDADVCKMDGFTLRGSGDSGLERLSRDLDIYQPGEITLLILDAKYRFFGEDQDENSNADQTKFHNAVDRLAEKLNCAIVLIHHSTKGNQSGKSVTDAGSGGGSQSRAVDTHLVIRPHADEGFAVLDAAVRTFPPVESQTLQYEYPLWYLASAVEPILKPDPTRGDSNQKSKDQQGLNELTTIMHEAKGEPMTTYQLHGKFGAGIDRVRKLIRFGINDGRIVQVGTRKARNGIEADLYTLKSYLPGEES